MSAPPAHDAAHILEHYPSNEAARNILLRLLTDTRSRGALAEEDRRRMLA